MACKIHFWWELCYIIVNILLIVLSIVSLNIDSRAFSLSFDIMIYGFPNQLRVHIFLIGMYILYGIWCKKQNFRRSMTASFIGCDIVNFFHKKCVGRTSWFSFKVEKSLLALHCNTGGRRGRLTFDCPDESAVIFFVEPTMTWSCHFLHHYSILLMFPGLARWILALQGNIIWVQEFTIRDTRSSYGWVSATLQIWRGLKPSRQFIICTNKILKTIVGSSRKNHDMQKWHDPAIIDQNPDIVTGPQNTFMLLQNR